MTGVMIIGILVIALQLVETMRKKQSSPPLDPEFEEMQREKTELLQWLQRCAEGELDEPDGRLDEFRNQSAEQLVSRLERVAKLAENRREAAANLEEAAKKLNTETRRLAVEEAARYQENRAELEKLMGDIRSELEKTRTEKEKVQTTNQELEEERNQIQDAIAQKQRQLEFAFTGTRTHTPILVECTKRGFRAAVYPPEESEVLDFQGKGFEANLQDLTRWLEQFDFSRYYPVLLYRDGALEHSMEIEMEIRGLSPKIILGRDPVSMSVEIFPK